MKSPPVSAQLKKAAGLAKASGEAGRTKIGTVKRADVMQIAREKMQDFNTTKIEQAMKIVEGTARSMGIEVVEQ
jgi:large subunit ribosomal protein L11